jgi:glycosyltransferase involved in cell wall biosynthesis
VKGLSVRATVVGASSRLLSNYFLTPRNCVVINSVKQTSANGCRLLYLVGQLGIGGLERQLLYFLRSIDRYKYKPVVVVWNYREEDSYVQQIRALEIPVISLEENMSRLGKAMAFRALVFRLRPEIVHSYSFYTNVIAWLGTIGSSALPVGSLRSSFLLAQQETGRLWGRVCARWPSTQICNSAEAKKTAENCRTLFKPKQMYLVRNGVDLNVFSFRVSAHGATLLAVGNLYQAKRWDRLIRITSLLSMKGIHFQVLLVGDGPLRGELESLGKTLNVDHLFQFLGRRKDIPELLSDCSLLVHTAEDEGCPNVIMEAMACGRATIAMDAGDISYLVEDGKTGFVVQHGDEATFAERVARLLTDHELCSRMGLAARTKAENEFRLERLVSESLAVYRSIGWTDS